MEKTCPKCGHTKPLTIEFWLPRKESRDGFRGICRLCWYAHYKPGKRASYAKHRERILLDRKAKRGTLDKVPLTIEQKIERNRAWSIADYYRHHEKRKADDRAYYRRNRDNICAKGRKYRAENAEYIRMRDLKWRILNPEKVKAKHRRYYWKNRDRLLPQMRERNRQRHQTIRSLDYGYTKGWEHTNVQYAIYRDRESQVERQKSCAEFIGNLTDCLSDSETAFLLAFENADYDTHKAAMELGMTASEGDAVMSRIRQIAERLR